MLFAGLGTVEFSGANYSPQAFNPGIPYRNYIDEAVFFTDDQAIVYGSTLDRAAVSATVVTREGSERTVPLTRVTAPIDASFFVTSIGRPDEALPLRVELRDGSDRVIATRRIDSPPAP